MSKKIKNIASYIEDNFDKKINFVCYADPPVPCYPSITDSPSYLPVIIRPKDWNLPKALKKTLESPISENIDLSSKDGKCISVSWNNQGGIIMLVEMQLRYILKHLYNKAITIENASICACTKHKEKQTQNAVYAVEAEPFGFITQTNGGCNPGSYNYFPNAGKKYNNAITNVIRLHNNHSPDNLKAFKSRPVISDDIVRKHFPRHQFKNNYILEDIANNSVVSKY